MIIIGLDPGLARTGYGVLDTARSKPHLASGCLTTSADLPPGRRLTILSRAIDDLATQYRPELVVIEQVYFGRNKTTAFMTAQVHGVVLYLLDGHAVRVEYVTPRQVKLHVAGHGSATKRQVATAVARQLSLSRLPTPDDAADALAIALTHAAASAASHRTPFH